VELLCGGDFVNDRLRCGAWVGGGQDWAAYDKKISARFDGFGGRCGAGLIVVFHCGGILARPDAWSHDQEIAAAGFSNGAGFLDTGDYTVHTGRFRQLRELHDARLRWAADSHFTHGFLIHAGQDCHRKQPGTIRSHWLACADSLHRRVEHGVAAESVHVDQLHPGHGGARKHGARDGVRNIVEFQVEKNAGTKRRHFADRGGTCRSEQLVADFEHADKIGYLFGKFDRRIQRIKIEGDDQAASRMGVKGQSYR